MHIIYFAVKHLNKVEIVEEEGGGRYDVHIDEYSSIWLIFTCSPVNEALKWLLERNFLYQSNLGLYDNYCI